MLASAAVEQADASRNSLLSVLPPELIVQILTHLSTDRPTLCSLACTNRFFQIESEKHIYATIELFSTNDLRAILEAFSRRPDRIASVETLRILYRFHDGLGATSQERKAFNICVGKMKGLRDWHVESPFDNFKWNDGPGHEWVEMDMEEFRRALEDASLKKCQVGLVRQADVGLAKLEKLVIHSHGATTDFWELGSFHCLFRHPSLRYLHVSCFVLPEDLPELEPYARSTPLTTLIFDECELEPKSVGRILRTPRTLKHLTLGENVYNIHGNISSRRVAARLSRAPEASLEALKEAAHSLETLTHHDPYWRSVDSYGHRPIPGDGMRDFHHLMFMDMDPCSFLHQVLLSHAQAPPNLEKLRLSHARIKLIEPAPPSYINIFETLPKHEPYTYLPSLKTLEFAHGASAESWEARSGFICQEDRLRERHAYAYKLYKHGITMKMYLEASWRDGLQPPYLQGEPKPRLVPVYDASSVGFRRHIIEPSENDPVPIHPERLRLPLGRTVTLLVEGPGTESSSSVAPPPLTGEGPETDQLNMPDIQRIRNELTRRLNRVWMDMDNEDKDDDDENDTIGLGTDDSDDDMHDLDDLDDLDDEFIEEWADMLEQEEDDDDDDDDDDEDDEVEMGEFDEEDMEFLQGILEHEVAVGGDVDAGGVAGAADGGIGGEAGQG